MSSRDIGPALPPHLKRNHRKSDEDLGSGSSSVYAQERNSNLDPHRNKHKEKYSERERRTDRERDYSRRNRHRDSDRSRGYATDKNQSRYRETKAAEKKVKYREEKESQRGSSKRSKRSKTDRTYNTDTEESSDENCPTEDWPRVAESDSSNSGQEDTLQILDQPSSVRNLKNDSTDVTVDPLPEDDFMMPALPPHLIKGSSSTSIEPSHDSVKCENAPTIARTVQSRNYPPSVEIGPALPPHLKGSKTKEGIDDFGVDSDIGPTLPPTMLKKETDLTNLVRSALPAHIEKVQLTDKGHLDDESDVINIVGPALPPHFQKKVLEYESDQTSIVGPALPPNLKNVQSSKMHDDKLNVIGPILPPSLRTSSVVGPTLPAGVDVECTGAVSDASSEEEIVGPLLPEQMASSGKNLMIQAQLERNAAAIKRKLEGKDLDDSRATRREEWMLTLPPEGTVDLGLGPRTFRARGAPEKGADRSAWTDTPADKARKEEEAKQRFELGNPSTAEVKKAAVSRELSNKDKAMESIARKHKRSKESLLDAHQKKLKEEKKKKEKAGVKQERRPFNRDIDLKANVFDDAQKKAIYKKAQILDSRFSSGESKYL